MKLLAIDFGSKRIGVAVSQGELALPLLTLARRNDEQAIAELTVLARAQGATTLVVGEPRRLDGTMGEAAERVHRFAARLSRATGLEVVFVVETLTSRAAEERLRDAGVDPRSHPERVDQVAAQILLEEALRRRKNERVES